MKGDFGEGRIPSLMLKQTIPLLIAEITNSLYSLVDRIYVGHIPDADGYAITGMGLVSPIITLVAAFTMCFRSGGAPICSIARGKGDTDKAERVMAQTLIWLIATGIIVMVIGYVAKEPLLKTLGASANTYKYADEYFSIYLLGTVFCMVSTGMNSFINLQGFPKTGMITVMIGAIFNLVLDPLFIFVLDFGIKGAAIATVLSQIVSAIWVFRFFIGNKGVLKLRKKYLKIDKQLTMEIVGLGLAGFVMRGTSALTAAVSNLLIKKYGGDLYIGAMTIATTIQDMVFMIVSTTGESVSPIISFNYGAQKYQRVKETLGVLFKFTLVYCVVITIVLELFPKQIASAFTTDAELIVITTVAIQYYFLFFWGSPFQLTGQRAFTAMGYAKNATFFAIFRKIILLLPLLFILPTIPRLGANGIFLANNLSELISGVICFIVMKQMVWKKLENTDGCYED